MQFMGLGDGASSAHPQATRNLHRPSDPTTDFAGLDFFISSVADHLTVWLGPRRLQPMILSAASMAEKLGVKCRGAMTHIYIYIPEASNVP